jgi:hypothetical protein
VKRLFVAGAVVTAVAAIVAAAAGACVTPSPLGGCGKGFTLLYNPSSTNGEGFLLAQNGHVNGDGWVCRNDGSYEHKGLTTIVDNVVPEQAHV